MFRLPWRYRARNKKSALLDASLFNNLDILIIGSWVNQYSGGTWLSSNSLNKLTKNNFSFFNWIKKFWMINAISSLTKKILKFWFDASGCQALQSIHIAAKFELLARPLKHVHTRGCITFISNKWNHGRCAFAIELADDWPSDQSTSDVQIIAFLTVGE